MLARYLGSKQTVLPAVLGEVALRAEPGDHVVDAFSGSLAVSLGLKRAGYRVTSNDVNLFSAVLAEAYLLHDQPPDPSVPPGMTDPRSGLSTARQTVDALTGRPGWGFLTDPTHRDRYERFVLLQAHLQHLQPGDLPPEHSRNDFFDAYCEEGRRSGYTSSRGSTGRRRFFSPANAARLDLILNQLRAWRREDALDGYTHALLLSTVLRAVEKVSNTQGTYHDFPRTTWDPRALQPLKLDPPPLDHVLGGAGGHRAGREQDSLDFVADVGPSRLLYLDPPYNFRQYSAYYFLPNVICRFPDMDDPDAYFGKLTFVRGQNPEDDFSSSFCKSSRFVDDLRTLIDRANSDTVLISYFNGANHWSKFNTGPSDTGQGLLEDLLTGPGFEPGSLTVTTVPRTNYASYGGYRARQVHELLLSAVRVQTEVHGPGDRAGGGLRAVA